MNVCLFRKYKQKFIVLHFQRSMAYFVCEEMYY